MHNNNTKKKRNQINNTTKGTPVQEEEEDDPWQLVVVVVVVVGTDKEEEERTKHEKTNRFVFLPGGGYILYQINWLALHHNCSFDKRKNERLYGLFGQASAADKRTKGTERNSTRSTVRMT